MPIQDATQLKEKIITIIRRRGPSLPVHIASETGLSILFASAFLSELISDRKIKISNLRVGNSPVYFLPDQGHLLERFSNYLKSKEKDAYLLLKEKKFLEDYFQDPAIRVALRNIKDFAVSFQKDGKIIWRYFTIPESEFPEPKKEIIEDKKPEEIPIKKEIFLETSKEEPKKELDIFNKKEETPFLEEKPNPIKRKSVKKVSKKKKATLKEDDKFFNNVKEFLNEKSIEIIDIKNFNKNDLVLKIKKDNKESLLIAYNKKKISEDDIIKSSKKAGELNLPYTILSLGSPVKKLENLIEAIKNLENIEKL